MSKRTRKKVRNIVFSILSFVLALFLCSPVSPAQAKAVASLIAEGSTDKKAFNKALNENPTVDIIISRRKFAQFDGIKSELFRGANLQVNSFARPEIFCAHNRNINFFDECRKTMCVANDNP